MVVIEVNWFILNFSLYFILYFILYFFFILLVMTHEVRGEMEQFGPGKSEKEELG